MEDHERDHKAGARLVLEPLRADHAREMSVVLRDPLLYTFIGGGPPSLAALEARYAVQAPGRSPDGQQLWLNWIVRLVERGQAVGFVQATVTGTSPRRTAEVAWVIGVEYQGRGYAREAVMMMLSRLQAIGVETTRAHIHPEHHASNAVARAAGLSPTGLLIEGEMRWQGHS